MPRAINLFIQLKVWPRLKTENFESYTETAYLKIDGVATAEEGRQWLESNDITIIAQASAPESIPLSPSEQDKLNAS